MTSLYAADSRLPDAADACESQGESVCREIIQRLTGRDFLRCRPDFLLNPDTGRPLELDGFCPELGLAFEYQGAQHYKYVPHFHPGGVSDLLAQQRRDLWKREMCEAHGVNLIIVPFYVDELDEFLRIKLGAAGALRAADRPGYVPAPRLGPDAAAIPEGGGLLPLFPGSGPVTIYDLTTLEAPATMAQIEDAVCRCVSRIGHHPVSWRVYWPHIDRTGDHCVPRLSAQPTQIFCDYMSFKVVGRKSEVSMKSVLPRILDRISYQGVCFRPWRHEPLATPGLLNLFRGFAVSPATNDALCEPVLDFIRRVWAADDLARFEYIIDWLAFLVQRPDEKPTTWLVVHSGCVDARDTVAEFIRDLLGDSLYAEAYSKDCMEGTSTHVIEGRKLVVVRRTWPFYWPKDYGPRVADIVSRRAFVVTQKRMPSHEISDLAGYIDFPILDTFNPKKPQLPGSLVLHCKDWPSLRADELATVGKAEPEVKSAFMALLLARPLPDGPLRMPPDHAPPWVPAPGMMTPPRAGGRVMKK